MTAGFKTLKKLIIDQDTTQTEIAARLGTSKRFVSYLIRGQRRSRRIEAELAKILGISPKRLAALIQN
jgi:plasmid maintenance system antidote protein VapI